MVAGMKEGERSPGMRMVAVELNRRRLALNGASSATVGASSATVGAQWRRWELNRDDGSSTVTICAYNGAQRRLLFIGDCCL